MALPTFLIVGAAKAGTTSLYHYLRQHPQVFMPAFPKESFFFSGLVPEQFPGPGGRYATGATTSWEAYLRLFAEGGAQAARGEACVAYLYYHRAAIPRILDRLGPDVSIAMVLRDPVERAYSNYLHHVRDGIEPLPFEQALEAAPRRRDAGWWWGFQYLDVGRYYRQVHAYLDAFGRDRVRVLCYEDLDEDTAGTTAQLFRFLNVDDTFRPDLSLRYNATGVPRIERLHAAMTGSGSVRDALKKMLPLPLRRRIKNRYYQYGLERPALADETRRRLTAVFREDILKLQDLIGRDLSNWLA